jgi:hypothetical protein
VLVVFRGCLANGLVEWDDDIYLQRIPELHGWSWSNAAWILTDTRWFYWHPLAYAFHAAEISLWGEDLRLHHFTSVALHALNACGVFALACAFLGPRRGGPAPARPAALVGAAFAAALLWALHPLRVESVAWIAEKKDLLCAFFSLAATAAWLLRSTAPAGTPTRGWTVATWAAFVLALAAKPLAVALPAAWLVLDVLVLGRAARPGGLRAAAWEKVPFLVAGFAAVWAGTSGVKEESRASDPLSLGWEQRVLTPLWGYAAPLVKTVVPLGLSPMDPQFNAEEIRLLSPRWLGSLALLAAGTWFAVRSLRRGAPGFAAAWFCYLALAAPVSGIRQLAGLATADRFSYMTTIPLFVIFGADVLGLCLGRVATARIGAARGTALAGCIVVVLAVIAGRAAAAQVRVWRNPETLWTRVLEEWPGRIPGAHDHLGAWYASRASQSADPEERTRLWESAARQFRAALRLAPENPSASNNLGRATERLGDANEAERLYRGAAARAPGFAIPRMNLARLCAAGGRRAEAKRWYAEALATGGWVQPGLRAEVERLLAERKR